MLSPLEMFDGMLERIQQFPLNGNVLERSLKRINKDHEKYKIIYSKLVSKLVSTDNKRYLHVKNKIKKCINKKLKEIQKYEAKVSELLYTLEEMIKISGISIAFEPLSGSKPAVIKLGLNCNGTKKYCLCNGMAQDSMICCENPKCTIKWYHFRCVNLTNSPKEKWICPKCKYLEEAL